jgi:predicted O-methyltransferase YrrM
VEKLPKPPYRVNVPPEQGRFVQLMVEATRAKRVLEIGGSFGYGSLWIARGLRHSGGKLITIELDKDRSREAREYFKTAGVDDIVTLRQDDAFKVVPQLEGQFDLIFCHAWAQDFKKFFELSLPKLKPGGLFLAKNAVSQADRMKDFLATVENHPQLITSIVQIGEDGFAVCLKKRAEATPNHVAPR